MVQCLYFFRYRTRDFQKMARKKSTSSRPCMTGRWRWAWHMRTSLLMVLLPRSEQIRKLPENVMRPLHTVKMCASFRPSAVCPIFHLDCRSVCMSTQHSWRWRSAKAWPWQSPTRHRNFWWMLLLLRTCFFTDRTVTSVISSAWTVWQSRKQSMRLLWLRRRLQKAPGKKRAAVRMQSMQSRIIRFLQLSSKEAKERFSMK